MTTTVERPVTILNRMGLHARPAAEVVKVAGRFKCDITISHDEMEVNGKSSRGVWLRAAEHGATITIRAAGPDAEDAVAAIEALVNNKFGER